MSKTELQNVKIEVLWTGGKGVPEPYTQTIFVFVGRGGTVNGVDGMGQWSGWGNYMLFIFLLSKIIIYENHQISDQ